MADDPAVILLADQAALDSESDRTKRRATDAIAEVLDKKKSFAEALETALSELDCGPGAIAPPNPASANHGVIIKSVDVPGERDEPAPTVENHNHLPVGAVQLPTEDKSVVDLPPRNGSFTGRVELLADIDRRLAEPGAVTLQGVGGIGKTQLALEYAHRQHLQRRHNVIWWVNADDQALPTNDLARLATSLGVPASHDIDSWLWLLSSILTRRTDWLLICDNFTVAMFATLKLPQTGRLLITGREPALNRIADLVEVTKFNRPESVTLLRRLCPALDKADADVLADTVSDLPLAIEQVGCFLRKTPMGVADYLKVLADQPTKAGLNEPTLNLHPGLASVVSVSRSRLRELLPGASEVLDQLAFLAPQPLPVYNQRDRPSGVRLGEPLDTAVIIGLIAGHGLARYINHALEVHALTQLLTRSLIPAWNRQAVLLKAQRLIATADPGDPANPGNWPEFEELIPHLNSVERHVTVTASQGHRNQDDPTYRRFLIECSRYLCLHGEYKSASALARGASQRWLAALGPEDADVLDALMVIARAARGEGDNATARDLGLDILDRRKNSLGDGHADTLATANELAFTWYRLGEYQRAHDLATDTLQRAAALGDDHFAVMDARLSLSAALTGLERHQEAHDLDDHEYGRRRQLLNPDHPDSLRAANNLAFDRANLGDHPGAFDLYTETLELSRRVLGRGHPDTLISAAGLSCELSWLGRHQTAHDLDIETLAWRREVLGFDHPDTLWSASKLAFDLSCLGDYETAREYETDTLKRRRRLLGDDHPDTLRSAYNLAFVLSCLKHHQAACALQTDTLERRRRILGPDHPDTLWSANNLAFDLSYLGDHKAARDLDEDTLERRCRVLGADHPDTKLSRRNLAFESSALAARSAES